MMASHASQDPKLSLVRTVSATKKVNFNYLKKNMKNKKELSNCKKKPRLIVTKLYRPTERKQMCLCYVSSSYVSYYAFKLTFMHILTVNILQQMKPSIKKTKV